MSHWKQGCVSASCSVVVVGLLLGAATARADDLVVVSTSPVRHTLAGATDVITINFDRAVVPASITASTFRVFGRGTGAQSGTFSFSNADQTVTLTPSHPFSAGEIVSVNLSHDIVAADTSPLRSAGYAFQYSIAAQPGAAVFTEIAEMSNRTNPGTSTRIYGAQATDLNGDGFLDLATVNEDSFDVRVFLSLADSTGLFGSFLSPEAIGQQASPNEQADFDNDGKTDGCFSATTSGGVWILRGNGDGTYGATQSITYGGDPHGVVVLDVDGDADMDIVNARLTGNNLALMLNNGSGTFGSPTFFEGGVNGEYGLATADMNNDGILDLVVGGFIGQEIRTLLGNGDGTFATTPAAQSSGGLVWVVYLGDLNGDGNIDATVANSSSNNGARLIGNGTGAFGAPSTIPTGAHTPSSDLGDLDGDGDLDWILSVYGAGSWLVYENDGAGNFTFDQMFDAPWNPSCAIPFDADNDGDIDLALTDEIADVVKIMENTGVTGPTATPACALAPEVCRTPALSEKALLKLQDRAPDDRDTLLWKWVKGSVTPKSDFGNPIITDGYTLCLYDNGTLVTGMSAPAGGLCDGNACWKDKTKGFDYKDKDLTPNGLQKITLREGLTAGTAKIIVKGKGLNLPMPLLEPLTGPLTVQLRKNTGGLCWGATYSDPFLKDDGTVLKDRAD